MAEASDKGVDRGRLDLDAEECKGCGLCVEACPPKVLRLAANLNRHGYHPVAYVGQAVRGAASASLPAPSQAPSPFGGSARASPR